MLETAFHWAVLACVVLAVAAALHAPEPRVACRTEIGACAQPGLPRCSERLGDWQIARSRDAGLPAGMSHSACVRRQADAASPGTTVSVVPQEVGVSGDTLVSRSAAGSGIAQRAVVTLDVVGSLPDHWAFAVAGTFLDRDTPHACAGLAVRAPVNAGYALIGGNWQRRPHGFYFERLADACVLDGNDAACRGAPSWIAHEFAAGEAFALDLALRREDDGWWLEATVAAVPAHASTRDAGSRQPLGHMRQRVDAPCWLPPGATGSALLIVIPDQGDATPETRVDVSSFAWVDAGGALR